MSDGGSLSTSDAQALRLLDDYYASLLGCSPSDLRRPGWTTLRARAEGDPMALLFGMRSLVNIIAPVAELGTQRVGDAGVAALAPEMREPVGAMLRETPPPDFFAPDSLASLNALVWSHAFEPLSAASEADLTLWYVTQPRLQPHLSPWQEWIERLDETVESDPFAIALLARHGGGVFVVRRRGAIIAYIGMRAQSPQVWEALEPKLTTRAPASVADHPDELMTALLTRATRFALNDHRQLVCATGPDAALFVRSLTQLGYQPYARSSVYTTAAR
ncbi:MAG TPA: hypothetical protein VE338_17485 [Ktedonobacterales bacterium]|jgi:hypothetical protein|nr:hypothetical protein [Ktedonobacterales bacterium]